MAWTGDGDGDGDDKAGSSFTPFWFSFFFFFLVFLFDGLYIHITDIPILLWLFSLMEKVNLIPTWVLHFTYVSISCDVVRDGE